jgi:hypothetical protein
LRLLDRANVSLGVRPRARGDRKSAVSVRFVYFRGVGAENVIQAESAGLSPK